jgi:lysophospholipase L1-like esterase
MFRRLVLAVLVLALVGVACKSPSGEQPDPAEPPEPPVKGLPASMIALGDSLTAAFGSCLAPTACPRNSWSTGDGTQVRSHYRRILADNPAIEDRARNLAEPGATADDLARQAAVAARKPADYVTILIGGNDACRGDMTSSATFRAELDKTLATLKRAMPKARVLFVSIPNIYRVWEIGHTNRFAIAAWRAGVCPNLLANPTSDAPADVARREAFRDRLSAYNGQIRRACAAYGPKCRYDNIAPFDFAFTMLSAIDFFHPNASGQEALAQETYPGRFAW